MAIGMLPPELSRGLQRHRADRCAPAASTTTSAAPSPTAIYDRFDWDVPVRYNGDCFDRYMVRVAGDAPEHADPAAGAGDIPQGEIRGKMPKILKPAEGRGVRAHRGPQGRDRLLPDLGRLAPRTATTSAPPSFINLTV